MAASWVFFTAMALLPPGFVDLANHPAGIRLEPRYATARNFVGQRVAGYARATVILSDVAAAALVRVQADLEPFGLGLKVFDGYRPQRAVHHFVRWAADGQDQRTKHEYYPAVPKQDLFARGYIASRSGHSRGSAVDLTLVDRATGRELDMGSPFDHFDPISHAAARQPSPQARAHRLLLRTLMEKHGFKPLAEEWWHFVLAKEPFPETYFDFVVE